MKMSTKGRYGLRLMIDLSARKSETPVPLKEIAAQQNISDKYLEQIVTALNRAGLVRSVRGAQGGYIIGRAPELITAGDVLRAVEGPLTFVDCVGDKICCEKSGGCAAGYVWREISRAVNDVADNISLEDLANLDNSKCIEL